MMDKKHCLSCGRTGWHNSIMKDPKWRCCFCGSPVTTNPGKREFWEEWRRKQANQKAIR